MTDFDRIEVKPEGIYLAHYHLLSEKAIKARRSRLQSLIAEKHRQIANQRQTLEWLTARLRELEDQLRVLMSPELEEWFQAQARGRVEAEQRAEEFLKQHLGEEAYMKLEKEGVLTFKAKDEATYRIDVKGRVYRQTTEGFKELCLIRDRNLPIPDHILAALTSVREEPERYVLRRR